MPGRRERHEQHLHPAASADPEQEERHGEGQHHITFKVPDLRAAWLWYRRLRHDRRNHAVLAAVADELASCGVPLMDSTTFIADHMASAGTMGRVQPDAASAADVQFGWPLLLQAVELDIGQSMAVRDRDVIAVEAIEGTDQLIARTGALCPAGGWTLVKVAKPQQDMRFDVPTIGPQTIENLHAAVPAHTGDWYFTGNYPTPGGNRVVNKAFLNFMEGKNIRGY